MHDYIPYTKKTQWYLKKSGLYIELFSQEAFLYHFVSLLCFEIQKATIRFETTPGLQAKVDWKENLVMISKNGEIFKVKKFFILFHLDKLKYLC